MSHSKRDPKSPYARYGKRPYLYSDQYQSWRAADDEEERAKRARTHNMKFLGFDPREYPTGRYPANRV